VCLNFFLCVSLKNPLVYNSSFSCPLQIYKIPPPSVEACAEYGRWNDCIPPALLKNAVVPKTEDELKALASTYVGDRQGMANTRDHQSHEGELHNIIAICTSIAYTLF
jgi:hypothetical protein